MRISDWSSDVCSSDLPTSWPRGWRRRPATRCRARRSTSAWTTNMAATDGHLGAAPDVNADAPDIAHHAALDARMLAVARGIKVLHLVSWQARVQHLFLEGPASGHNSPPRNELPRHDLVDARREPALNDAHAEPAPP